MIFRNKRTDKTSIIGKSGLERRSSSSPSRRPMSSGGSRRSAPVERSPVFSYYANSNKSRNGEESTSRRVRTGGTVTSYIRRLSWKHAPSYLAFVAILVALVYSCYLQPNPKIILINTPGSVYRDSDAYNKEIQDIWKNSLLNRTKLTVSTGQISNDIKGRFNELDMAQIELPLLGRRPTVRLTPSRPALQLISNNGSFYVDNKGKVMARITDVKQNDLVGLPIVRDETGILAEAGKLVLSEPETTFITKLYAQLQTETIPIESITLPANAAGEADVRVTGQSYFVKFSFDNDPRQAVGTYIAAKAKLDADSTTPAEYMDVRVEEKVFYR